MTAVVDERITELHPGCHPHRRITRYLEGTPPIGYVAHPTGRHPRLFASLAVLLLGPILGSGIGAVTGAAVAAWFYVIGALWGAPIGAVVGGAVGIPASVLLVAVLLTGPRHDAPAALHRTAATLAGLLELLVAVELLGAVAAGWNVRQGQLEAGGAHPLAAGLLVFGLLVAAIALYGWLDLHLLRRACRTLADEWNDVLGLKPVRS